jgi:hypothetical protein
MQFRLRRLVSMTAVAVVSLVLLTTPVPAAPRDPLFAAFTALGAGAVHRISVTGFGATYAAGPAAAFPALPPRVTLKRYEADIDYAASEIRTLLIRETGPVSEQSGLPPDGDERVERRARGADAWEVLATPHGFLKAARASEASTRPVLHGVEVRFQSHGRPFVGLINLRNEVDRVQTWMVDPVRGDIAVETLFRDYETGPGGVRFPTHITQHEGGRVALDVWVSSVRVNPSSGADGQPAHPGGQ